MTEIIFRRLPGVAEVERQLDLHARDRLLDDEIEELPNLIDGVSLTLFGIVARDTFYWAVPDPLRIGFSRAGWEEQFDVLGQYSRDPNAYWRNFGLDVRCEEGRALHCLQPFGRQLICALDGLHPRAVLAFADSKISRAA